MLQSAMSAQALSDMVELAKRTPRGDFAEVGVYKGGAAELLYKLCQFQKRELWLYDTFTGIPTKGQYDIHNVGDFGDVDYQSIAQALPLAHIQKGYFPFTLGREPSRLAFVHEDTDQYQSTRDVISCLWPRLIPGGIMLFDDYNTFDCPGSRRAINEAVQEMGLKLQQISGKVYAVKPR